ncbi:glycosyltransferase [Phenylobacterium sp.]|jgi:glycosyltransferase involved in cell wall biosynthesis|uniref:glycosyltransferase n=1 Tax=Phenylobacterium sp. TaxID=1871053 RepID=UPI002F93454B
MDREFYVDFYRDVVEGGLDPALHYLLTGWRERRDPAPWFSTAWYLAQHPQVEASGLPPFFHYLTVGRAQGWAPAPPDWRVALRSDLPSVPERIAAARRAAGEVALDDPGLLTAALAGVNQAHVTVSHDDYTAMVGGVQLCIGREGEGVRGRRAHIHLFPAVRLPAVSDDPDYAVVVLKDGERIGAFPLPAMAALGEALGPAARSSVAIHNLLGHHPERLADMLAACRPAQSFFWVHDFAAACDGYTLLWNDERFCGGPPRGAEICRTCVYGPLRARHLEAHDVVFAALDPLIVAPSAVAAEIWTRARSAAPGSVLVHPHAELQTPGATAPQAERAVRVAFLGLPLPHKGWPAFAALAAQFAGDARYEFHHFGEAPDLRAQVNFHRVTASAEHPDAMIGAVKAHGVDLAVVWSICPETFCLTAHEAVAAGVPVIAFADSGGAAALASRPGNGLVLPSEDALADLFASGEAQRMGLGPRPAPAPMRLSGMSCDLMGAAHG